MWPGCGVVLLCVAGVWWQGAWAAVTREEDPVGCGPALDFLVERKVAEQGHLSRLPSGDGDQSSGPKMCGGGACCVPEVTEALREAGKASLGEVVKSTADNLLSGLTSQREAFYSAVEGALASSERRAVRLVESTYPRVAGAARRVLRQLYAGLLAGLTHSEERSLERTLSTFWDDLFPPVYHSVLHAHLLPFAPRYTECLREARREVQPWGIIPTLVGEPILRGLHSARLLLHALDVGIHSLDSARGLAVGPQCGEAAARLQLCGACHGTLLPPCPGLCLNVARGCLAPLAEVDGAWADLAGAVDRVQEALQVLRLAHQLHQLPDKLSEAIMMALEHGPQLLKKVRRDCSSPMYEEVEEITPHHPTPPPAEPEDVDGEEQASERVLECVAGAARVVDAARHWWAGLPETHCETVAAQDPSQCWNGVRVAPYTKTTAGVGISAQKYNPEVRLDHPDTSVYSLADKLRSVRRLTMSKLAWLPKSDSLRTHNYGQMDGSGSGVDMREDKITGESYSRSGSPSDDDEGYMNSSFEGYYDEDADISGYGSGDTMVEKPIHSVRKSKTKETASSAPDGGSAGVVSAVSVLLAVLFTIRG